jgi:peptide/nickel transport system substrate-binding protein
MNNRPVDSAWRMAQGMVATCHKQQTIPFIHGILFFLLPLLIGCRSAAGTPVSAVTPTMPTTATATLSPATPATPLFQPTATAVSTPTPAPNANELIICQANEPDSLYLYSQPSLAQQHIHHTIYETLYTQRNYSYQPLGLSKLPQLSEGDARLETITVSAGDIVVDTAGIVIPLDLGIAVSDASGQPVIFAGSPINVVQMVVEFELEPMVWSDGQPVTAADSVFSFNLARMPAAVVTSEQRQRLGRTADYEAAGERTVRWVGLPGWRDSHYFLNVWPPLPAHRLSIYTPAQLSQVEETVRRPLASGPFVINEWVQGSHMRLIPNPHYHRAGTVALDGLLIRFIDNPNQMVSELLAGRCHLATHDSINPEQVPFFQEAAAAGLLLPHFQAGPAFELLAFGVQSFGVEEPDIMSGWFADEQVRQAAAMCINRERLVAELLGGITAVMPAYIQPAHPLLPGDLHRWPYDVEAANSLLDDAGYLDINGNGIRQNEAGEPFTVRLLSSESELHSLTVNLIAENLAACGLTVTPVYLSELELFDPSPASPLAGRRFDLALLRQTTFIEPPCIHWQTAAITGPVSAGFGGWGAANVTGWSDAAFDEACQAAQQAFWNSEPYRLLHRTALRRFVDSVPALPLYSSLKVALTRPELVNFSLDPTQPSELWNVGAFVLRE